mmetsp:Transcript_9832/g.18468  ORF Transcript_9832/g.18468 Transcript_9832/m.18468 type:complete len:613 (+) Transcript_9832:3077-4915(+)
MGNQASGSSDGGWLRRRLGGGKGEVMRRGSSHAELSLDDFECPEGFLSNIGVGGFGRVLAMVKKNDPSRRFAVKCMHKGKIIHREQVDNCLNELGILRRMEHYAYLVNLFYAFQDEEYLYMCTDLMLGGTLQRALKKASFGCFADQPERICLYAAELTLALQFLHSQNVVHRDVKPDNILLDADGHLHLTDFNVSMYIEPGNEETQKHEDGWGTRGYRAPEVYLRTGAGFIFACDWWSVGAVVYEMFTGHVPYPKLSKEESSSDMLMRMKDESVDLSSIKAEAANDFVKKILRFNPEMRLGCQHGCNSEVMIMTHPYFAEMDWDILEGYKNYNQNDEKSSATTDYSMNVTNNNKTTSNTATSQNDAESRNGSGNIDMSDFAGNFDSSLDQKEKLRILQRNMGVLGFQGLNAPDADEEDFPLVTNEQQELFKDWLFNVDFKLAQQRMPKFALLQTISSMNPTQIKEWIDTSSSQSLKALCSEMKAYREQAMKENFDHVMAQMRIDKLHEENLRLTRKVGELESKLGVPNDSMNDASRTRSTSLKKRLEEIKQQQGGEEEDEVVLFHPPKVERSDSSLEGVRGQASPVEMALETNVSSDSDEASFALNRIESDQ